MAHAGAARVQKQLLVLGCSATKVATEGFLPVINLYDGPTFRVLREGQDHLFYLGDQVVFRMTGQEKCHPCI
jgi:hypothetical protein